MWIDELKIAIVAKDIDKFEKILSQMPKDENLANLKEASELILQAKQICQEKMDFLNLEFEKFRLARKYSNDL